MAPPGTPPEAQSAPADAQSAPAPPLPQSDNGPCPRAAASPPFAGERAQAASRAKKERAALVQKEEARLKAEVIQLRTQVRQARAQNALMRATVLETQVAELRAQVRHGEA